MTGAPREASTFWLLHGNIFSNMIPKLLLACSLIGASLGANFTEVVGAKWQIILTGTPNTDVPTLKPDVEVWDIDLEYASKSAIADLKSAGKIVICYFSSGTFEDWRLDANKFTSKDKGKDLPQWPGEKWLDLRSANVRNIMRTRMQSAASKGCDAIDPDNTGLPPARFSGVFVPFSPSISG
jgi:hypothetical protein